MPMKHLAALLCALPLAAAAQTVTLNGSLGVQRALLVIDGTPHAVVVGATVKGVRLVSLSGERAEIELAGTRRTLALGAGPVRAGTAVPGGGTEIVLTAGSGGHFKTMGQINGQTVEFMVDTGATAIVIGQADADRMGLAYKNGRRGMAETANGRAPYNAITLSRVRVGDVEVPNVEAAVIPAAMGHVLLGNSFLNRFSMRRDADVMRLEKKN
jgi:aspartyl protease family protein